MSLNPERMKELKEKYNITDEAIYEIADSLEPEPETEEHPIVGSRTARTRASEPEPLSGALGALGRGEMSFAEAIIYLDWMDRRERRDQERTQPRQSSDIDRLIEKMDSRMDKAEEKSKEDRAYFEKLILGKKIEETEERASRLEGELKRRDEEERQSKLLEAAQTGALEKLEPELRELRQKVADMPPNQQKSFWEEVFGEVGDEIKRDMTDQFLKRIRGEEEKEAAPVRDKEGKIVFNWENFAKRLVKLGEKYLDTMGKAPPKLPVREISTPPFSESPAEVIEGEVPKIEPPSGDISPIPEVGIRGEEIATLEPAPEEKVPGFNRTMVELKETQPETEVVPEIAPATTEPPPSEEEIPTLTKKTGKGQARKRVNSF